MNAKLFKAVASAVVFLGILTTEGAVGTVTGPYSHRNLQLFLIHGETRLESRNYVTLSEAMT
ncbi:MAG TPA: hypothetical protein VLT36_15990, partial [Candidatus Dormibacteraeota bacterium]|nr:hypothetical protein [Candidatus Dormibacteraeota bacterium]